MVKGHLNQTRQGIRSTKVKKEATLIDILPQQEPDNHKSNYIFETVIEIQGQVYSDQTGYFPRVSNRGMKYIIVFYAYGANYIKGIPIKS
eukprot:15366289-Ditylum_brightwellii.AAC.2